MNMKKVIVISGGSDGLGKEVAKYLTTQNNVVILSDNNDKLIACANEIGCDYQVCDVSSTNSINSAIEKIKDKYHKIDCLINNAGLWIEGTLDQNDESKIREVIEVNTTGYILLTKSVLQLMKEQKDGFIINVISQAGLYAKAERSVYTASKWAITGFTKSIQQEAAKDGIRVTGLYPGKMNTKMFEKSGNKKTMDDALEISDVAKVIDFILTFNNNVVFPEIGIKNIKN